MLLPEKRSQQHPQEAETGQHCGYLREGVEWVVGMFFDAHRVQAIYAVALLAEPAGVFFKVVGVVHSASPI